MRHIKPPNNHDSFAKYPNYPNENVISGNIALVALTLNAIQSQKAQEARLERLRQYRLNSGKDNKISTIRSKVSRSDINEIIAQQKANKHNRQIFEEIEESPLSSNPLSPETSQAHTKLLKKLTRADLKEFLKNHQEGDKIIDGIDFSGLDLSEFNLDNLIFKNSNFAGSKFPSMKSVRFENSCNLHRTNWSQTTQENVFIGDPTYENNVMTLVNLIAQNQVLINDHHMLDDIQEIQSIRNSIGQKNIIEVQNLQSDYIAKTSLQTPILDVSEANFRGVDFKTFHIYSADFSGSHFDDSTIKIKQGVRNKDISFYAPTASNLDLTGATLEFFDNQDNLFAKSHGTKSLDLSTIDESSRILIGHSGIISKEYHDLITSDKEIIIEVNANPDFIPHGLKFQSISEFVKSSSLLTPQKIEELQQKVVEIGNDFFSRYNIKFVSKPHAEGMKKDFTLHFNLVSGIGSALASGFNSLGLGSGIGYIAMDEVELGRDFSSIVCHEIAHNLIFQHPFQIPATKIPAITSYLTPMAKRPDAETRLVANNQIKIAGFTENDQKVLEQYMKIFNRKPHLSQDLVSHLDLDVFGAKTSYNPNPDLQNIVKISPEIFDKNLRIVLMPSKEAVAYCLTSDLYSCEKTYNQDNTPAIILMSSETGFVESIVFLAGENPRIKIGDGQIFDPRDLMAKNGFSNIISNNGEIHLYKFEKIGKGQEHQLTQSQILHSKISQEEPLVTNKFSSLPPQIQAEEDDDLIQQNIQNKSTKYDEFEMQKIADFKQTQSNSVAKSDNQDSLTNKISSYFWITASLSALGLISTQLVASMRRNKTTNTPQIDIEQPETIISKAQTRASTYQDHHPKLQ